MNFLAEIHIFRMSSSLPTPERGRKEGKGGECFGQAGGSPALRQGDGRPLGASKKDEVRRKKGGAPCGREVDGGAGRAVAPLVFKKRDKMKTRSALFSWHDNKAGFLAIPEGDPHHSFAFLPLSIRLGAAGCRTSGSGVHGWREIEGAAALGASKKDEARRAVRPSGGKRKGKRAGRPRYDRGVLRTDLRGCGYPERGSRQVAGLKRSRA